MRYATHAIKTHQSSVWGTTRRKVGLLGDRQALMLQRVWALSRRPRSRSRTVGSREKATEGLSGEAEEARGKYAHEGSQREGGPPNSDHICLRPLLQSQQRLAGDLDDERCRRLGRWRTGRRRWWMQPGRQGRHEWRRGRRRGRRRIRRFRRRPTRQQRRRR